MKKAFKTIFIYLGVLLLAGIATVVFCAGFLFFYRDGNIFGIQYINKNEITYARENEDMSTLQTIEVNSSDFDVRVKVHSNVSEVMGAMRTKVFGYAKKSGAQAGFNLEYDETTQTAVFTSNQPKGWLNRKGSYIEVAIPSSLADAGINIRVITAKGDIIVGGDTNLKAGTLDIITTKGDATVTNVDIGTAINVNIGKGLMYIDGSCSTANPICSNISVGTGTVNFAKINVDEFSFGVIEIKSMKRGKVGIIKAEEVVSNGNFNGGGSIEIGEVGRVDLATLDTDISINKIVGFNSSRIIITGKGDILINEVLGNLEIEGHNGNVKIGTVFGTSNILTNHGDITMTNALKLVSAVTAYGNINITYSNSALDFVDSDINDNNKNRMVVASTKNGHIVVRGLQNGYITATDKGRISLEYDKVVGNNVVTANSGSVNIIVPNPTDTSIANEFAFNLTVNSEVNSDIKVGVVGSIGAVDFSGSGYKSFTNIYNTASSTSNNLNITSTTGVVKVRSADLVAY